MPSPTKIYTAFLRIYHKLRLHGEPILQQMIYDRRNNCCAAFEIKHSGQAVPEQARHLRDDEKCTLTQRRFGSLAGKYVLYQGKNIDAEDGILYRNAEAFLKMIPKLKQLEKPPNLWDMNLSGNDRQAFQMTM